MARPDVPIRIARRAVRRGSGADSAMAAAWPDRNPAASGAREPACKAD